MSRLNWIVAKHNGVFPSQEYMCMGQNGGGRTPVLALHAITHLRRTREIDSVRICTQRDDAGEGLRAIKRLRTIIEGIGVGSQLWKLLESLGVKHTTDCTCLIWAELMNSWGPAKCRESRAEIVEHMESSAKSYGWTTYIYASLKVVVLRLMFRISITDPYGSLLDEAIRRAELAEEHSKCQSVGAMG